MTQHRMKIWQALVLIGVILWVLFSLVTLASATEAGGLRLMPPFAVGKPQTITSTVDYYAYLPLTMRSFSLNAPPLSPSELRVTPVSYNQVRVEWRDNAFNETGFTVYEGSNLIATLGPNVISYTAGGFEPTSYHCFTVYAFNAHGRSEWSGWKCTVTLPRGQTCAEGLVNGGFESNTAWDLPTTEYPASYTTLIKYSGARAMCTGIVTPAHNLMSYSSARQPITIPTNALTVTLKLWLYQQSSEVAQQSLPPRPTLNTPLDIAATSRAGDVQYVLILDAADQIMETLFWERRDDRAWQFYQYNLVGYAGRSIKIHVGTYNDGLDGVTGMYVDEVALTLCAPE